MIVDGSDETTFQNFDISQFILKVGHENRSWKASGGYLIRERNVSLAICEL